MKKPIVIVHTNAPAVGQKMLALHHPEIEFHGCDTYECLPKMVAETSAEVVFSVRFHGTPGFPRQALIDAPSLRWVSIGGSGIDHMTPWDPSRLTVTNAAGVAADMMAQYALGAMLHFSLGLDRFRDAQNRREWLSAEVEPIDKKVVLIIGLGKTGEAVAARSKALGLISIGVRANPRDTANVDEVHGIGALPDLWSRADFIVICVPLLDNTRNIVSALEFAAMKKTAVVVDVSRGGVIDEEALITALDRGGLRGAALDVFTTEPLPTENPLWGYQNVIITPHCSSVYRGWELKSVEMFSQNLMRYRRGEALQNIVNPERGY